MKKSSFLALLLSLVLLATASTPVGAATVNDPYEIAPCYVHCDTSDIMFTVSNNQAIVKVLYEGIPTTFTQAQVTVKIQKRFLGIFWSTVDIGLPDNEWVAYNNNVSGSFYNTFPVDGTGTYRAKITLEVFGLTGVSDVIEETIECKYE